MNKTNKQIKQLARQNLLGHYRTAIGAFIIAELIILILNIPFDRMAQQGLTLGSLTQMLLGIIGSLIVSLVATLFQAGVSYIHLRLARRLDTRFTEIFFPFKNRPDRYIGYGILNALLAAACIMPGYLCIMPILAGSYTAAALALSVLGCVLLIIGCIVMIVVLLSWSMVAFILLEDNNITVMEAIRQSRRMMKGKKGRFFLLGLSFIGWLLFSLLSLGIALLWIIPYLTQSQVCFYLELLPKKGKTDQSEEFHSAGAPY